jgi:Ras-related protein Rab-6A
MQDESINMEEVLKYKMIFVGDQSTGKSCILNRFANNQFDEQYQATIGLDFQSKNVIIKDQDVRLLLYDTAGQEKFRSLIPMYIRESHIVLFVYDITRKESFENIPKWFSDVLDIKSNETVFVLVGNKIDLESERQISYEEGEDFAQKNNMYFFETSAKTGKNIENLFLKSVKTINERIQEDFYDLKTGNCGIKVGNAVNTDNIVLNKETVTKEDNNGGKCCSYY